MLNDASTTACDLNIIRQPYIQTIHVLRCHKHQLYVYHPSNQPNAKCDICGNVALARYVHTNNVNTLLCDECVSMRAEAPSWIMDLNDTLVKMKILRMILPSLKNTAMITFERMLYHGQLQKFDKFDFTQRCILCHCVPACMYGCGRSTILVCNGCGVLARNNISIRVHKMYLGSQVIAGVQQHDIYTSTVRLYLALLWDFTLT